MVNTITLVPVHTLPVEEATPQVEHLINNEETPPIVQAETTKLEPEILEIKQEIDKVYTADIKPDKVKQVHK